MQCPIILISNQFAFFHLIKLVQLLLLYNYFFLGLSAVDASISVTFGTRRVCHCCVQSISSFSEQVDRSWLAKKPDCLSYLVCFLELAFSTVVKKTSSSWCSLVKQELSRIPQYDTAGEAFALDVPLTPSSACVVSGLEPYLTLAGFPQGSCQTSTLMILGWS